MEVQQSEVQEILWELHNSILINSLTFDVNDINLVLIASSFTWFVIGFYYSHEISESFT